MSKNKNEVTLVIQSELSGEWDIAVYDKLGNLLDETSFVAVGGPTYSWNLQSKYGTKVASGTYILVNRFTGKNGIVRIFKKTIGVKE